MITLISLFALQQASPQSTQEDHQSLLKQLGIEKLRPGVDGMNPKSVNFANTDELKANTYDSIPDLMTFRNGDKVRNRKDWDRRRKELVEDLDREIYGVTPKNLPKVSWKIDSEEIRMMGDSEVWIRKVSGVFDSDGGQAIKATIYTPKGIKKVPMIVEYGFSFPRRPGSPAPTTAPPVPSWQAQILAKNWGFTILEPTSYQADNGAGLRSGIIGYVNKGQPREPEDWGALKAWAWGASRLLDFFEKDPTTDAKKVAIEGLSRFGKAAIVTMAYEPRFATGLVGSSGQGGVKIWRRNFGETVENVASSGEYHWMGGRYVRYAGPLTPKEMPVDAHSLLALVAPRPVFIGVGSLKVEGIWIDPVGTFLATKLASPAWEIYGKKGLSVSEMPQEGIPAITGDLAFSQHTGGHTNGPNWTNFLEFTSRYF
jgi:hypothetical protein